LILIQKIPKKVNKKFIDILKDTFIPPLCVACGKITPELLCRQCISRIKVPGNAVCSFCGKPLYENERNDRGCSFCKKENFNFYRHRSFALYSGEIKNVIRKYKYNKIYGLKEVISLLLERAYSLNYIYEKIDYMETVPGRHMNELCCSLSGLIKIPFAGNILKIKRIAKQQGLDFTQRRNNIKEAFKVKNPLMYYRKNILLIDDVWTTGSTLDEISRILKKAGADKIYLLTLARGIP
jgi:competence protein ComFC